VSDQFVRVRLEGREVSASPSDSIIQAYLSSGQTLVKGVGCMGQGVCGSCRVMVRRAGSPEVSMELGCETRVEDGMQVSFLEYGKHFAFTPRRPHVYSVGDLRDSWQILHKIDEVFPEAAHCRHCGGCNRACPKKLEVERGVDLAVAGDIVAAAEVFDQCVMCNLCTLACPEYIRPNHLGLFVRRMIASLTLRPADLVRRLQQIERGEMKVDLSGASAAPAP
jgi:ferredoxin